MPTGREIINALLLKIKEEERPVELEKISQDFIKTILDSRFSEHTKKNLFSRARHEIKNQLSEKHPILEILKPNEEFYLQFEREKQERIRKKLSHKVKLSYPDYLKITQALVNSPIRCLQFLGFALSTGRRVNECVSHNFSVVGEKELFFTGQSKTREEKKTFIIPTLSEANKLIKNLQEAEAEGFFITKNKDHVATRRVCQRIFGDTIHSLRSRYQALILKREGVLESDSTIDPLIRAKELLGHEWVSDATLAYYGFAVSNKSEENSKEILKRIRSFELLNRGEEKKRRVRKGKTTNDIMLKILKDHPYLSKDNLQETRTILRQAYKTRTGRQLNSKLLNAFLLEQGLVKDIKIVLSDMEKFILKNFDPLGFCEEQKRGIIELWRLWRKKSTKSHANWELAKEKLGEDLTKEEFLEIILFFKSLE